MKANNSLWNLTAATAKKAADDLIAENLGGGTDVRASGFSVTCNEAKQFVIYYSIDKDSPLGLGSIVTGGDHVTVQREAEATITPGTPGQTVGGCALCFIGTADMGTGNADYKVTGGSIHINSDLNAGPNGVWTVQATGGKIGISGTVGGGQFSPAWVHEDVIADPLASMALPLSSAGLAPKSNPCTDGPGIYGAFALPKSVCTLSQGAYVITGKWSMKNGSTLTSSGSGVTLYFKSPNGALDVKNGTLNNLAAPAGPPAGAPPGWPSGFAIIYDRNNTNDLSAQGNGSTTITGGIYAASATIDFNGNSEFHILHGPVVVASGTGNGNPGTVFVDQAVNVGGTPLSAAPGTLELTK
jgi:hypothetical protein